MTSKLHDSTKNELLWRLAMVLFGLVSLVTAFHSAPHRGRTLEIGFPAIYLREYAGESWNLPNLAVDLAACFLAAFLCVASFFKDERADP